MQPGEASEDLATATSAALERTVRMLRTMTPSHGLSYTSATALSTLERTGPRRLTALADSEGVTQPAMTQVVGRLQELGLIARAADPDDGRVVLVTITDAGRAELARRREARASILRDRLASLTPAQQEALRAALPVLDALASMQPRDLERSFR
jgi:DNA-binding MarR family transcriptional regulator